MERTGTPIESGTAMKTRRHIDRTVGTHLYVSGFATASVCLLAFVALMWGSAAAAGETVGETVYLSDDIAPALLKHQQQWGDFGRDTAAAAPGRPGSPLRIGDKTFAKGLGHHANGEITIDLAGQYAEFRACIGVQWQGGDRGSVVFQVQVDDRTLFQSQPMTDSDPAQEIDIPLNGATAASNRLRRGRWHRL